MATEQDQPTLSSQTLEAIEELAQRGDARSDHCIELSELSEVVEELELDDDEAQAMQETLEQRGFDLRDDCGKDRRARDQLLER